MAFVARPIRKDHFVWRDIAGEVVIAERDNSTVRVLNRTASLIWTMADGKSHPEDIAAVMCNKFEVAPEQALADVDEFCQQLLKDGLITYEDPSRGGLGG
jgi:hypothetical protein